MKLLVKKMIPDLHWEILLNSSLLFLVKISNTIINLVIGIVLARVLGAEGFGQYAFPMAIISFLTIPATAGLPQLLVRTVSQYVTSKKFNFLKGLLIQSNKFVVILSVILGLGTFIVLSFTKNMSLTSKEGISFLFAMSIIPFIAINNVQMSVLRGLGKMMLGQLPGSIFKPIVFLLLTIFTYIIIRDQLSYHQVIIYQLIATIFASFISLFFLIKEVKPLLNSNVAAYNTKEWFQNAIPFMFLGTMQVINKQTDIIMLGFLRSPSEVGVYKAVVTGSMFVTFVMIAVGNSQAPQISRLWILNEKMKIQKMLSFNARIITISTLFISLILIIFGKNLLNLFFGTDFANGYIALRILSFGQLVNGIAGTTGTVLNMTGHEKLAARAVALSALINILLNSFLIPQYGIEGAAFASAISLSTWNLLLIYWLKKFTGLNATCFSLKPFKKYSIGG